MEVKYFKKKLTKPCYLVIDCHDFSFKGIELIPQVRIEDLKQMKVKCFDHFQMLLYHAHRLNKWFFLIKYNYYDYLWRKDRREERKEGREGREKKRKKELFLNPLFLSCRLT